MAVLTLAGHAAGGGTLDPFGICAIVALSTGLAATTARRRPTWARVLIVLLAAQALLHVVLTFTSDHAHPTTSVSVPTMVIGHVVASMLAATILVRADALLDRWAGYVAAVIGAPLPTRDRPQPPSPGLVARVAERTPSLLVTRHRIVRRGPPALLVDAVH